MRLKEGITLLNKAAGVVVIGYAGWDAFKRAPRDRNDKVDNELPKKVSDESLRIALEGKSK